jgi:mxaA protein
MRVASLAALFVLSLIGAAAGEVRSVRLTADRSFGFFVGDVVTAHLEIIADESMSLKSASLPLVGPLDHRLDLRDLRVVEERASGGAKRWRVDLAYQIFYVALDVRDLDIPSFSLRFSSAAGTQTVSTPVWKVGVSPLREVLPQRRDDPADYMRPDSVAIPADAATPTLVAAIFSTLAVGALALLARDRGWPPFHHRRARVFAVASRRIASFARANSEASRREALLTLHRAIDATAGRRVFAEDLDAFLARHDEYARLRDGLAQFFAASRRLFFGAGAGEEFPFAELAALARRLAECERAGR